MHCNQAQEIFSDHLAGQLDSVLNMSLENHLRSCEACRTEVAGLRRVWSSLDALPVVEPPAFFHENLMHRIGMEQEKATEAAQQRRSIWNWRALFQLRSPLFAGAALLLLALAGMSSLHVQHASLDPIGSVWRLLHSGNTAHGTTPALQTARAEWRPNGQGGGTLTIYAQAQPGTSVSLRSLNYRAGGEIRAAVQNDVSISADHETALAIPMEARPTADLTLTLSAPGSDKATVPVTLMEPVSPPLGDR